MPSPTKAAKAKREAVKAALATAATNPLASDLPSVDEPIARTDGYDNAPPPSVDGEIAMLKHWQIQPDPNNPRQDFDPEEINLLADSIREHGLMQNLVAAMPTRLPDCPFWVHVLISGERRWRAIGQLVATGEWPRNRLIPVRIIALADEGERAIRALVENLVRRDLKPLEEARAFQALRDQHGVKTDEIAARINRGQRMVQQRLQLLDLSDANQAALEAGKITIEDARRILSSRVPPIDLSVAEEIVLAEFLHARDAAMGEANATGGEFSGDLFVGAAALTDDALISLCAKGLISGPYAEHRLGIRTGRQMIRRGYNLSSAKFARPLPIPSKPYATQWLNGPFDLTADQEAAIAAAQAERDRERSERIAAEAAEDAAWAAQRASTSKLLTLTPPPVTTFGQGVLDGFKALEHPLPWCIDGSGDLFDANRKVVLYAENMRDEAVYQLIAFAVNGVSGQASPEAAPADDGWADDDDEDTPDDTGGLPTLSEILADIDAKGAAQ